MRAVADLRIFFLVPIVSSFMLMRLAIASRLRLWVGAQQFLFPFRYVSGRSEIVRDLSELVSLSVRDFIRGFLVKAAVKLSQRYETTKLLSDFF